MIRKFTLVALLLFAATGLAAAQSGCIAPGPGFNVVELEWKDLWRVDGQPDVAFPQSRGHQTPVGSFTTRDAVNRTGYPATGLVLTTKFVMDGNNHKFGTLGVQPVADAAGKRFYARSQPADQAAVSISRCRADLNVDRWTRCGALAASGNYVFGPTVTNKACQFHAGETLWLTVYFARSPYSPVPNTCSPPTARNPDFGVRCDVNAKLD